MNHDPAPTGNELPDELAALAAGAYREFAAAAAAAGLAPPPSDALPAGSERAWALSNFVARTARSDPGALCSLVLSGDLGHAYAPAPANPGAGPRALAAYAQRIDSGLGEAPDEATLVTGLRRLRRREMLRIAWRDLAGLATLEETVRDASDLADAVLHASVRHLQMALERQLGVPESEAGDAQILTVLALGKLGARELNFSSDIDLIFAFAEAGRTHGAPRGVSNETFFTRLGQRLIRVLDDRTSDGCVFRVDLRLRPFGASGPLAMSFNALEDYYQTHGRDWERYALIRMRPVTGDTDANAAFIERLRPFVYRRYFDFGALESLREMKAMIDREVAHKGLDDNLKLGRGGIREVEFVGQAFQMVRGGCRAELRHRNIMTVLARLGEPGYLPAHAVVDLASAYRFLRDSEHRLQEVDDRQTHSLPADPLGRLRLAVGMGYPDWPAYNDALTKHRARVSAHFDQIFGIPESASTRGEEPLGILWSAEQADTVPRELLAAAGYQDVDLAWATVLKLRETRAVKLLDSRGQARLRRLLPDLLRAAAGQPNREATLGRVLRLIETVARRSAYLALLAERPLALSQFVQLCAASPWIARLMQRHPVLLDELLDSRQLYTPLSRTHLDADLAERFAGLEAGDTEREMAALRHFKQVNVLRVAAADVSRRMPLMVVSEHLTQIAECAVNAALRIAYRDLVARYGEPRHEHHGARVTAPFVVVAYGKLGGLELGYGSDLDLIFLHGSEGETGHTDGPREVDNSVFFSRLAQRLMHFLSTATSEGVLYEVDPRLRPSGAAGMLVNRLSAYAEYLDHDAWTWEHQALVRARVVAGDTDLARRFARIRRKILLHHRDPETLRSEVCEMRERMRGELGGRASGRFDLKQDRGGIADIEFMVQYAVLRWASRLGEYLDFSDNIRLLEGFGRAGLLGGKQVAVLTDAYRIYRGYVHAAALQELKLVLLKVQVVPEHPDVL